MKSPHIEPVVLDLKLWPPLSFYIVQKKPALSVTPVAEAKLTKWIYEIEFQNASGILSIDGMWPVNLMSATNNASVRPVLASQPRK